MINIIWNETPEESDIKASWKIRMNFIIFFPLCLSAQLEASWTKIFQFIADCFSTTYCGTLEINTIKQDLSNLSPPRLCSSSPGWRTPSPNSSNLTVSPLCPNLSLLQGSSPFSPPACTPYYSIHTLWRRACSQDPPSCKGTHRIRALMLGSCNLQVRIQAVSPRPASRAKQHQTVLVIWGLYPEILQKTQ